MTQHERMIQENTRWMVGAGVRLLLSRGCGSVEVDPASAPDAAAEAAQLAAWRYLFILFIYLESH